MLHQLRQERVHRNVQSYSRSSLMMNCMHGDVQEIQPNGHDSHAISYTKKQQNRSLNIGLGIKMTLMKNIA